MNDLFPSEAVDLQAVLPHIAGDVLSEIDEKALASESHVNDLHISGDTLIVARTTDKKVLFYKMTK